MYVPIVCRHLLGGVGKNNYNIDPSLNSYNCVFAVLPRFAVALFSRPKFRLPRPPAEFRSSGGARQSARICSEASGIPIGLPDGIF
jgi:hypothetical protein